MKTYIVMLPEGVGGSAEMSAKKSAVLLGDHWRPFAFLVPTLWLIYHKLWLPLSAWVALNLAIIGAGSTMEMGLLIVILLGLARLYCGLEGSHWIIDKYQRDGWHMAGLIEARNRDHAEWQFAHSHNDAYDKPVSSTGFKTSAVRKPIVTAETFGLLDMSRP